MKRLHSDQGFTLIEIMAAVTIFAIGLLALAAIQVQTIQGNAYSHGMTEATGLAQGMIEDLLGRDYESDPDLQPGSHQALNGRYTLDWTVAEDATYSLTKTIAVEVSWQEKGLTKRVAIDFVKAANI